MDSLAAILERHRFDAMLREASVIRDYPECRERLDEAGKMIRFLLYEFALGRLDAGDRDRILDLLHFASEPVNLVHKHPIWVVQDDGV